MIKVEHVVLEKETYDGLMTQKRLFEESEKEYIKQIKLLSDRETIISFEEISDGFSKYIQSVELKSDDEVVQAAFDELKDQHKKATDKLMNRNLWQRLINKKP